MKNILLGTTALIGAALFAGAANAETPKVTVGGYANFQVGVVGDDMDSAPTATQNGVSSRAQAFRSDTQVQFRIDGKTDAGLGYGGGVNLLADTTTDVNNRGINASATWIYLDGAWGRAELGSNIGAQGTLKVDAASIARATGGISGDWYYYAGANQAPGAGGAAAPGQIWATPDLALGYGAGVTGDHSTENLNKVTYYTPRFAGFQLGLSYLPDQANRGQGFAGAGFSPSGPLRTDNNPGQSENIFAGGVNYDNKFGDFGVTVAATGEHGEAQATGFEDLNAWNAGAKVTFAGFSVAGSYGDLGESNRASALNADGTHYWTAGVAYEFAQFGASVTYLNSEFDNGAGLGHNDFENIVAGVDYKLAPGLTPYAEVSFYDMDPVGSVNDNSGTVGIVGTQLTF